MATNNYPSLGASTNDPPPAYNANIESAPPLYDEAAPDAPPGYNPDAPSVPLNEAPPAAFNPAALDATPQQVVVPMQQPQPQVVYQAPTQQAPQQQPVVYQPVPQGAPQQQPVVYQQPQQVVYQQPPAGAQGQPQVVYVNQFGQPIAPPQGQQQVVYAQGGAAAPPAQIQMQPMGNQNVVIAQTSSKTAGPVAVGGGARPVVANHNAQQQMNRPDDPMCLYVFAVIGLFIWPIGVIGMFAYSCGQGLPPRQATAFKFLSVCIVIGIILSVIYFSSG